MHLVMISLNKQIVLIEAIDYIKFNNSKNIIYLSIYCNHSFSMISKLICSRDGSLFGFSLKQRKKRQRNNETFLLH